MFITTSLLLWIATVVAAAPAVRVAQNDLEPLPVTAPTVAPRMRRGISNDIFQRHAQAGRDMPGEEEMEPCLEEGEDSEEPWRALMCIICTQSTKSEASDVAPSTHSEIVYIDHGEPYPGYYTQVERDLDVALSNPPKHSAKPTPVYSDGGDKPEPEIERQPKHSASAERGLWGIL